MTRAAEVATTPMWDSAATHRGAGRVDGARTLPMDKLVLMSILMATVVIPVVIAREQKLDLALKRLVVYMSIFVIVYALACSQIYLRIM
jgi:hypothetical protein